MSERPVEKARVKYEGPSFFEAEMENDEKTSDAGKTEEPVSGTRPPEAKMSSENENASVPGPRRRHYPAMPGARELRCMTCNGFIGEVKGILDWSRFKCHRCKAMSSFAFESR